MYLLIAAILYIIFSTFFMWRKLNDGICKTGQHMVGKVVIITGGNAGIGYEAAKNFAERGGKVILACRNDHRAKAARDKIISETGNKDIHFKKLDLTSFASVRAFADEINKNEKRIDVLINNAGIIMGREKVLTEDGLLLGMQANHFGHFLLTNLLLDKIKASAPSRIINVSSGAHYFVAKIDFDNLNNEKDSEVKPFDVYANSKLCNVLMTTELARQLNDTGVTTNSMCPGPVRTEIINGLDWYWYRITLPLIKLLMAYKTPWMGAQTIINLAVARDIENVSGEFYGECALSKASVLGRDAGLARKLWEVSEKLCKLK